MRCAVILAGGNSRRLGVEKSLLQFEGRPLLCWTVDRLSEVAEEIVVVARDEEHARKLEGAMEGATEVAAGGFSGASLSLIFTWDRLPGYGPVAGIAAGMEAAKGRYAFTTACDLPFLSPQVVNRLFEIAQGENWANEENNVTAACAGAVPVHPNGFFEPLHSVYHRETMRKACEWAIEVGERRIHVPLQEIGVRQIPVDILRPFDCDLLTFFNLNTREDLEKAKAIWPGKCGRII